MIPIVGAVAIHDLDSVSATLFYKFSFDGFKARSLIEVVVASAFLVEESSCFAVGDENVGE